MGPERRALRDLAREFGGRGGGGRLAAGGPGPAANGERRVHDRLHDGELHRRSPPARHAVLARLGWDVEARGLYGAPEIDVVIGDEAHVTILAALQMLGLGRERVKRVATDGQGRMTGGFAAARSSKSAHGPLIVCAQAGNVNTGAFDPLEEIAEPFTSTASRAVWLHVDGAFGLWAAASPSLAHLVQGAGLADSWATDGHKWLNVPYDSGIVIVDDPESHRQAMTIAAAYLVQTERRRAGPVRLRPRVLAPGPRLHRLGRPALARAARGSRSWSSAAAPWRGGSRSGCRTSRGSRSSTTSS